MQFLSGRSLTYLIPMLELLVKSASSRALLLFPTKALAQDQLRIVRNLCSRLVDGGTPFSVRKEALESARVLLTNPDMLHCTLLPHFAAALCANLALVVLDEAHT